jgi:uridine kinase
VNGVLTPQAAQPDPATERSLYRSLAPFRKKQAMRMSKPKLKITSSSSARPGLTWSEAPNDRGKAVKLSALLIQLEKQTRDVILHRSTDAVQDFIYGKSHGAIGIVGNPEMTQRLKSLSKTLVIAPVAKSEDHIAKKELPSPAETLHSDKAERSSDIKIVDPVAQHVIRIGIAGASGSGKSTLAESISAALGSYFHPIPMDNFVTKKHGFNLRTEAGFRVANLHLPVHFDKIKAVMDTYQSAAFSGNVDNIVPDYWIRNPLRPEALSAPRLAEGNCECVISEGAYLFASEKMTKEFDLLLWIEVSQDTAFERLLARSRSRRTKQEDFTAYFLYTKWPNYQRWRLQQISNVNRMATLGRSIVKLDGTLNADQLCAAAIRAIRAHCSQGRTMASETAPLLRGREEDLPRGSEEAAYLAAPRTPTFATPEDSFVAAYMNEYHEVGRSNESGYQAPCTAIAVTGADELIAFLSSTGGIQTDNSSNLSSFS